MADATDVARRSRCRSRPDIRTRRPAPRRTARLSQQSNDLDHPEAGTGLLGEAYAALDHLLGSRLVHAGADESVERGLVRRRGRDLSAGGEERQMCLDDRVRIVMQQARGPELSPEVVTLRLQLSGQAAIEDDRP